MTELPQLATQNFRDFKPEMGVPVRITRGAPRFKLKYDLTEEIKALAPEKDIFGLGLPHNEFERRYREDLNKRGFDDVLWRMQAVAKRHPGETLVLLCFEKVLEGEHCHRRAFARWWETQTGQGCPELYIDGNTGEIDGLDEARGLSNMTVQRERVYFGPQYDQESLI